MQERHQLLLYATGLHAEGVRENEIIASLRGRGASDVDAATICAQGRRDFEDQLTRKVTLPISTRTGVNYYFVLGVTPRSTTNRIRQAFLTKAKVIHPDRHNLEFSRDLWVQLMAITKDAEHVLTDETLRRAYDIYWLRQSRRAGDPYRTRQERRGDWKTRYFWYMGELAEMEEQTVTQLDELAQLVPQAIDGQLREACDALAVSTEMYEERILSTRTQSYAVPEVFGDLTDEARRELQRKDNLARRLKGLAEQICQPAGGPAIRASAVAEAARHLSEVRWAHHRFDIARARQALTAAI